MAAPLLLLASVLAAAPALAGDPASFKKRAAQEGLWGDAQWLRLGHWRPGPLGLGLVSDAEAPGFFLSPSGRRDPASELDAMIDGLFSVDGSSLHPRCRFPARTAWLLGRLGADERALPPADCSAYRDWRALLDARSASLVFAAAYLNNPSSMFGHTFLRLERSRTGESERLLDNTLNFAAETGDQNGFLFAVKGLLGLYPGRYTMMPYHMKVQEYSGIENRDIWEYRLDLSPEELDRLAAHAWEMGQAVFPYYFFSKNCSYQLMPALEAAAPRVSLLRGRPVAVGPVETVRAVVEAGLVRERRFRPSHATVMAGRRGLLSTEERRAAEAFAFGSVAEGDARLSGLAPGRRALALDSAQDYVLYKKGFNPEAPPEVRELERELLVRRARLPEPPLPAPEPRFNAAPEEGHARQRFLLGGGVRRGARGFSELGYRPGYHDLLDSPRGFPDGAAIELFSARVRWQAEERRAHVHDARLAEILSASPWDGWVRKPAWSAGTGVETAYEKERAPHRSHVWEGHAGSGGALEPLPGAVAWALLQAESSAGPVLDRGWRVGGALRMGVSARLGARLHALLDGALAGAAAGDKTSNHRLRAGLNWSLGRDRALRAEGTLRGHHREAGLHAVLYL